MNPFETAPQKAQGGRNMLKIILRSGWALALVAALLTSPVSATAETDSTVVKAENVASAAMGWRAPQCAQNTSSAAMRPPQNPQ